jgi:monoamine oxidase
VKVAVVGLGISGLRAWMLLEEQGVEVLPFEARDRLAGRLHTVREPGGVVYDAGGEWLDADHSRTLNLINSLGLEPEATSFWPGRVVYRGKESTEDLLWSDALEDELRVEAAAKEMCRDVCSPPWRNPHLKDLESQSLADFLKRHCHSERGLWWMRAKLRSDEGDDPENIGLLGWLCGFKFYMEREPGAMSAYRMPGGGSKLCEAMAAGLRAEARFGSVLRKVCQNENGLTLHFEDGSATVDAAVLTLPPPALERVVFEPPLPVEKRCAIEACKMSRAIKICWQFEEPWWLERGWNGRMICDGPLQQTWDGSRGSAAILTAYICGAGSAEWSAMRSPEEKGLEELQRFAPGAPKSFVKAWFHDWPRDPFARGAFSHLGPGYVLTHMEHVSTPHGRVYFAGEHTALWIGFIEGALESAERVVEEVRNERAADEL